MGTLTANMSALPEHCRHKLPTSCRLTATPTCCACQDKRPHVASYPTYVDGIGLVARGTRWQRYCWFCREFWSNRVAAMRPPLEPRDTRVPDEPDQSEFLDRWFDFHRGYEVQLDEHDGSERRVELQCEKPWRDVPPGELPLLNEGDRVLMAYREVGQTATEDGEHVSLDNALDDLLAEVDTDRNLQQQTAIETAAAASRNHVAMQVVNPEELSSRIREANVRLAEAEASRRELALALTAAQQAVRAAREAKAALTREAQTARYARVFGTREETQRPDYESPITSMFVRAYDRYNVAQEVRQQARIVQLNDEQQRRLWTTNDTAQDLVQFTSDNSAWQATDTIAELPDNSTIRFMSGTLDDADSDRPPPVSAEELTVRLECKICLQQVADTACLPCGHLVMCQYCAAIAIPCRAQDRLEPAARNAQCPLCRKGVRRLARIHCG